MEQYIMKNPRIWVVDYAFETEYQEGVQPTEARIRIVAKSIDKALEKAAEKLEIKSHLDRWSRWMIWDIGIVDEHLFD